MNSEQRREKIISVLQMSDKPVSAACFAGEFSVTRQIIVADIALLRAKGHQIRAEHKGYVLEKSDSCDMHKRLVVKHGKNEVRTSFMRSWITAERYWTSSFSIPYTERSLRN